MSFIDILTFLIPSVHEPVQLGFFLFIVLFPFWSGYSLWRRAKESTWQSAWEKRTGDSLDDLDIEHGSIKDLSEAVAAPAERLAEIVPGILLVVGLLGTFIGIGVALNKAAAILGSAQGTDGAASAMKDMLPMLQGLGTKFKTSTWGIIGYLSFKAWYSKYNKEEDRLRWCIIQGNKQLLQRRADARDYEDQKQQAIIGALNKVGEGICRMMHQEALQDRNVLKEELSQSRQVLMQEVQNSFRMAKTLDAVNASMSRFIEVSLESTEKMSQASDSIAGSATALDGAVAKFSSSVETTLGKVTLKLDDTLAGMTKGFTDVMTKSAGELKGAIDESGQLLRGATDGIHLAVKEMSGGLSTVLAEMNESFVGTMGNAAEQLRTSMVESSRLLQEATSAIFNAVDQMSRDVGATQQNLKDTLDAVATTLKQSEDRQLRMQLTLETSSQALKTESKIVMSAVKEAIGKLEEQLRTVSSGNLEMTGVVRALRETMRENTGILKEFFGVSVPPEGVSVVAASDCGGGYS